MRRRAIDIINIDTAEGYMDNLKFRKKSKSYHYGGFIKGKELTSFDMNM